VHERPITVNGWQGSGYSIIDADYGVGAYKISGGSNGGSSALNSGQKEALAITSIMDGLQYIVDELLKKGPISQVVSAITKTIEAIKKCETPYAVVISLLVLAALMMALLAILKMTLVFTAVVAKIVITVLSLAAGFLWENIINALIESCPRNTE
jgi:hypothetical protein